MRARKRFGQHFLDAAWADKLVRAIGPGRDHTFLEVGPGRGALTLPLAAAAGRVVAVEIDRDLAAALVARAIDNLEVITANFLDLDLARLGLPRGTRIAGNLPYNVSSPILFRVLDASPGQFADGTFMLQREVVDRLVAKPGTRDYGVLSILVALRCRVTRLMTLPPGAFRPRPAVTSAVVRLEFLPAGDRLRTPPDFEPLIKGLFSQRRKTLLNGLRAYLGPEAAGVLAAAGLDGRRRAETLSLSELAALATAAAEGAGPDVAVPPK